MKEIIKKMMLCGLIMVGFECDGMQQPCKIVASADATPNFLRDLNERVNDGKMHIVPSCEPIGLFIEILAHEAGSLRKDFDKPGSYFEQECSILFNSLHMPFLHHDLSTLGEMFCQTFKDFWEVSKAPIFSGVYRKDPKTGGLVAIVSSLYLYLTEQQRDYLEANLNDIVEFGSK